MRGKHLTLDELICKFREIHGDTYVYDYVEFVKMKQKVKILCREHGIFMQTPQKHLYGQGCPICGNKRKNKDRTLKYDVFLQRANRKHNFKYIYYYYDIKNEHIMIDIMCPKHGLFPQRIYDHLNGHGCPVCGIQLSNAEIELFDFIKELGFSDVVKSNRTIIKPYEIDIYIPSLKIGIEYNGLKWHSDEFKPNNLYHLNKLEMCSEKGVELIQIFEDEYVKHKDAVLNRFEYILLPHNPSINYEILKCNIVSEETASLFTNKFNTEAFKPSVSYVGCYLNDEIIGVMLLAHSENGIIITQFSENSTDNHDIIFKSLFYFVKETFKTTEIVIYADRRWLSSNEASLYESLGFKKAEILNPTFKYIVNNERVSESDSENVHKIWDCGLVKYVYKR